MQETFDNKRRKEVTSGGNPSKNQVGNIDLKFSSLLVHDDTAVAGRGLDYFCSLQSRLVRRAVIFMRPCPGLTARVPFLNGKVSTFSFRKRLVWKWFGITLVKVGLL